MPFFYKFVSSPTLPVCYFKTRDTMVERICIGEAANANSLDLNILTEQNSDLLFVYTSTFSNFDNINSSQKSSVEWGPFLTAPTHLPFIILEKKDDHCCTLSIQFHRSELEHLKSKKIFYSKIRDALTISDANYTIATLKKSEDLPSFTNWNNIIERCLQAFRDKVLSKVVIARKQIIQYDTDIDPLSFFNKIINSSITACSQTYIFFLRKDLQKTFISLTPERLFLKNKNIIEVDAIAGTRARGINQQEDYQLEQDLLNSQKEMAEHRIVSDSIKLKLESICTDLQSTESEKINKLNYVQHIRSQFRGILNDKISSVKIIKLLHPTPAVGGHPENIAKEYINELEPFDRGLYASPVGIISKDYSEIVVGIRSILIDQNCLHIFGGAGIVNGSTGIAEWKETTAKMNNFLYLL